MECRETPGGTGTAKGAVFMGREKSESRLGDTAGNGQEEGMKKRVGGGGAVLFPLTLPVRLLPATHPFSAHGIHAPTYFAFQSLKNKMATSTMATECIDWTLKVKGLEFQDAFATEL